MEVSSCESFHFLASPISLCSSSSPDQKRKKLRATVLLAGEKHRTPLLLSLLSISFSLWCVWKILIYVCLISWFMQLLCCWNCKSLRVYVNYHVYSLLKIYSFFFLFLNFEVSTKNIFIMLSRKRKGKWFLLFFKFVFMRKWQ